ncbi:MAG: hypothetical protein QW331_04875, partial [Candidatus Woesearchaeota archaeon]
MKREVIVIFLLLLPIVSAQISGGIYPYKCYDGIKDGDETGVDCGGSCAPCGLVPESLLAGGITSMIWIVGIVGALLILFLILFLLLSRSKKKKEVAKSLPPTGIAKEIEVSIELQQYIENMVRQGYTMPQIKAWLLQHGYDESNIEAAFAKVLEQQSQQPS